ncbi:M61 family metallopeptidase [Niastella vici]|nr:peptidase M61 [Niastella vici]
MKNILLISVLLIYTATGLMAQANTPLVYTIDLTTVKNDKLQVSLNVPPLSKKNLVFAFPKIIPGTYNISDFGKFVSELHAWDRTGKKLAVQHLTKDTWTISNAANLRKITYSVEDIFDTRQKHIIYPMAATNFEAGQDYVLNLPGVVGFFEGFEGLPVHINFKKPLSFYASTAAIPVRTGETEDEFAYNSIHEAYDQPLMYNLPDTATVQAGICSVLVSVYSPNKLVKASSVAGWLSTMLHATLDYLNGKLLVDKYAFIYYFKPESAKHTFPPNLTGALEHTTSSFYYVKVKPEQELKQSIIDMSSHEFLHIITPLTIASKEVKLFNYLQPHLSKHLWLYEGVTEYTAHHIQVKGELITPQEFYDILTEKIATSRKLLNDSLSFTDLSKESAGRYASQFLNVYLKGAMIGACLDIYLLHLSKGTYGLKNLVHELGVKYGRERFFNDDQLFETIVQMTYPEIGQFFTDYVAGARPIPYEYFFDLAGVEYLPKEHLMRPKKNPTPEELVVFNRWLKKDAGE